MQKFAKIADGNTIALIHVHQEGRKLHNEFMILSWRDKSKTAETDLDPES